MSNADLSKKEFHQMLTRYLENRASADERKFVEKWYAAYGHDVRLNLNPGQRQEIEDRLWDSISRQYKPLSAPDVPGKTIGLRLVVWMAASVLLLISFSVYYYGTTLTSANTTIASRAPVAKPYTVVNNNVTARTVSLEDGTVLRLEPKSSLQVVNINGGSKREVRLEGEAFFEVAHDSLRPFFVYTGNLTTRVLGTSFTVTARADVVSVAVKTGKVSVTQTTQKSGSPRHTLTEEVILTPNQKAVYNGRQITMTIVEKPQRIAESRTDPLMVFDEQPVTDILSAIAEAYGIEITYDEEAIRTCMLTTTLSDEDLFDRLSIICKAIKGTYEVNGSTIRIKSKGCN